MPFFIMICFSILMISSCMVLTYQSYQDKVIHIELILVYGMLFFSFFLFQEDITRKKELEKSLLENENSKGDFLENIPGMAYRCNYDREWTMQFVSSGCEGLTGYKPSALIGNREHSFNEIIVPKYREHLWMQWKN